MHTVQYSRTRLERTLTSSNNPETIQKRYCKYFFTVALKSQVIFIYSRVHMSELSACSDCGDRMVQQCTLLYNTVCSTVHCCTTCSTLYCTLLYCTVHYITPYYTVLHRTCTVTVLITGLTLSYVTIGRNLHPLQNRAKGRGSSNICSTVQYFAKLRDYRRPVKNRPPIGFSIVWVLTYNYCTSQQR